MSKARALIVEDNTQNLRVLSQLLAKYGVECIEVSNSASVREMLDTLDDLDIAFLDLEMPRFDGFKIKDLLRSRLGNLPIIAYTAHTSEMGLARESGFDGFLGKPLDPARFPELLARILNGEQVWERT